MTRVLAIEDSDAKWARVEPVARGALPRNAEIVRVGDLFQGERLVEQPGWDLLLLDISLDIKSGGSHGGRGAHDYLGGLKIAGRMFYNECEIPTIILTGFDAFPSGRSGGDADVILGREDVEREARRFLRSHLLGTVRVGAGDWAKELTLLLEGLDCAS